MKKDDIYKLIEYSGIYDEKVKKNLKKLIKKYHPDKNKKDKKTIEIIYEVKKELENNSVSYKKKKDLKKENIKKKNDFITEDECLKNIIKLSKDEINGDIELNKLYDELSSLFKKYSNSYRKFCLSKNIFCELEDQIRKYKKIYFFKNIILIILIVILIICLIYFSTKTIIIVLILIILLMIWSYWYTERVTIIKEKMQKIVNDINKNSKEINFIQNKIKELRDKICEKERKNTNIKNDIRFYRNMKNN